MQDNWPFPRLTVPNDQILLQFLVVLCETDPLIWRRIQVPSHYSFWDLHVAIQDAMGWKDYHLHEFQVARPAKLRGRRIEFVGIPGADPYEDRHMRPGWKVWLADYFDGDAQPVIYTYDFGDNWRHVIHYETFAVVDPSRSYPCCVGGARRCPPEDCGGIRGYREFLEAIADPTHPEHESYLEWVGGSYDPDDFDPDAVTFDDPHDRWMIAFSD
ncbi:MAG: plasmid pRiA4b ORF-3 family protein [Limnochordia bacterium]